MKLCSSVKFFIILHFCFFSNSIYFLQGVMSRIQRDFSSAEAYVCTGVAKYFLFPFQSPNYVPAAKLYWKFNIMFTVDLWFISWAVTESSNSITLELKFGYFFLNESYAITYTKFHYVSKLLNLLAVLIYK